MNLIFETSNLWLKIRDYFIESFSNIRFGNIIILITGIICGFLLFGLFYLILVFISFKKNDKIKENSDVPVEEVDKLIYAATEKYTEVYTSGKTNDKLNGTKEICLDLVKDIARLYFPTSQHPELELSIDEVLLLISYIRGRVDTLLNAKGIKPFRRYRISQIQDLLDLKKKIDNNKLVKAAKKAQAPKIALIGRAILNYANPAFWVYKAVINPFFSFAYNKLMKIIIRIVGEEAYKVYSKSALEREDDLQELIADMEKDLEKE